MDKKLVLCIAVIVVLAGAVLFFVLRDLGFFGRNYGQLRGRPNVQIDNNAFLRIVKRSLGLPESATESEIKEALGLPEDATIEQIRSTFMQQRMVWRDING